MRIIAKSSLIRFWQAPGREDSKSSLENWHDEVSRANWCSPQDVKDPFGSASICANNRVVFNIGGNKYRLVTELQYRARIVWVKFIGTHKRYDEIDVETVNEY